jgi:putative addiction module antidote protein, CC2985 family
MATKTLHISLPEELDNFVQRTMKSGRYEDESEVVREALRRMEAADLKEELAQFERAFAGGHDRAESDEDIKRVEAAVQAGRKR